MDAAEILAMAGHRQFPPPAGAWVMRQEWHNLLFAHWACAAGPLLHFSRFMDVLVWAPERARRE